MAISENIKLLREKYRLSQKDLALIAGVSDKAVSTWERGLKEPRMGAIQKIADHFGIKKSNLIEDGGIASISTLPSTNNSFTPEEINIIKKYRRLTPEGKKTVLTILDLQYEMVSPKIKNDEVI
ncbi:helix-turn-helix transcriptional regulator [Megasphaera sp.]|jgi:transcriptional regulator with XRE-family HTH domain|uniref:helix-turn-helix transcriptional regulator n=1 Tax=Megasphaera sp. TaxID=2023260 RepID=UPI00205E2784|nr:MAG TPA: Repressor protein CI [Caudoviricetes sp.]